MLAELDLLYLEFINVEYIKRDDTPPRSHCTKFQPQVMSFGARVSTEIDSWSSHSLDAHTIKSTA